MKNFLLYLSIFVKLTASLTIQIPKLSMKNCLRVTNDAQYHTILVEDPNSTDTLLKECIIKNIHLNQTITLLKDMKYKQMDPTTSNQPNLIVMTKLLGHQLFDVLNSTIKEAITFHWNLLYIVVTENEGIYKCNDGRFFENTFSKIQSFMNDLWHRFEMIQVVLAFPFSCPGAYVIYGKNIRTNTAMLNRTTRLIRPKSLNELLSAISNSSLTLTHGYPLKTGIFYRFPTSMRECHNIQTFVKYDRNITNGYCGLDGLVMQDAIKYFKFNIIFSTERRCNEYGYVNWSQQVATGSLGCVIDKTLDVSFNSRFMVMYSNENFHYLQHVMHDSLCALLPIPKIYALWHYPHAPINSIISFIVIIIIAIIATVAWISSRIMNILKGENQLSFQTLILDFSTSTLCGFSLKKYKKLYVLRGLCLVCSIIILSFYQGYINYSFTTFKRYQKIKTLQGLYDLKYVLHTSPPVWDLLKPLKNPNNPQEVNFVKRAKLQSRTDIGIVLKQQKSVTLGRYTDVRSEILLRYRDKYGKPMIYVVDECFRLYYLSHISRFGFPFTEKFKIFTERLVQAGIPEKYYKWTRRTLHIPDSMTKEGPEPRPIAKIKMEDQIIPFGILLSGYAVSTIVFIFEHWLARRHRS